MIAIYTKEKMPKLVHTILLSDDEIEKVLNGDPYFDRKDLDPTKHIVVSLESVFINPILDNDKIREMNREEKILLLHMEELLSDGEVVSNNEIQTIECTEDYVEKKWNKELKKWEEGADKEAIMLERKNKILEYHKCKEEIVILKEMALEFESDSTVKLMEEKLNVIRNEINSLGDKIKRIK